MWSTIMPASIMFSITVVFVSLLFIPAIRFQQSNKVVNFYWVGVWLFLGLIASFAGAQNTLMLLGYNTDDFAELILFTLTYCLVIFVMFGWFRLSFKAFWHGVQKLFKKMS